MIKGVTGDMVVDNKNEYENASDSAIEIVELIDMTENQGLEETLENQENKTIDEIEKIGEPQTQETQEHKDIEEIMDLNDFELEIKKNSKGHTYKKESKRLKKVIVRTTVSIITVIMFLFLNLLGVVMIINYGPSETVRNLFVDSVMESSAGKFLATSFFSPEKIVEIRAVNSVVSSLEVTDSKLIAVNQTAIDAKTEDKPIEIIDVVSSSYKGKMVIVRDPSRVTVGVSGSYGAAYSGATVKEMAQAYNAVIAVNGGGFEDVGGVGNGGTPIGIVISDGKLKFGSLATAYDVIGFDNENKLVVGRMTGKQALERGIRDALSFGPILIVNGTSSVINGSGSGPNPRTAIGQRADGAMLLLVIDGRQTNSVGATYADLVEIMLGYGAVNAANLDGGSSTVLYYNGEYINKNSSINGPRNIPTSILVR